MKASKLPTKRLFVIYFIWMTNILYVLWSCLPNKQLITKSKTVHP